VVNDGTFLQFFESLSRECSDLCIDFARFRLLPRSGLLGNESFTEEHTKSLIRQGLVTLARTGEGLLLKLDPPLYSHFKLALDDGVLDLVALGSILFRSVQLREQYQTFHTITDTVDVETTLPDLVMTAHVVIIRVRVLVAVALVLGGGDRSRTCHKKTVIRKSRERHDNKTKRCRQHTCTTTPCRQHTCTTTPQHITLTRVVMFHVSSLEPLDSNSLSNLTDLNMVNFPRNSCNGYVVQTVKQEEVVPVQVPQYAQLTCLSTYHTFHIPNRPWQDRMEKTSEKKFASRNLCKKQTYFVFTVLEQAYLGPKSMLTFTKDQDVS